LCMLQQCVYTLPMPMPTWHSPCHEFEATILNPPPSIWYPITADSQ